MTRYVMVRLLAALPVALGVASVVFIVIRLSGDPVDLMLPPDASREQRDDLRQRLGLDAPPLVQYSTWLGHLLVGDLGRSLLTGEPVTDLVFRRVGPTVLLTVAALTIAVVAGVLLGTIAGVNRNSGIDRVSMVISVLGTSMPSFWLGLLLLLLFSVRLGWLPTGGMYSPLGPRLEDLPAHLVLPAVTLGVSSMALIARLTRSSMLEVIGEDFIRTARAKGLRYRVIVARHALKNALIPVVTIVGLQVGNLLGGAIIVESIFSWPGVGSLMLMGISQRDFPLVQGAVLVIALAFVLVTLVVDLLYAYLDPRIRYG
jgi:ABC-type dipeptide/oligopeptide/nickel transport system permease component